MLSDRRSRLVALLMKGIYAKILDAIEDSGYDVFCRRARVGVMGKMAVLLKTLSQAEYL